MQSVIGLLDFLIRVVKVLVNLENRFSDFNRQTTTTTSREHISYYASRRGFGRRVWD